MVTAESKRFIPLLPNQRTQSLNHPGLGTSSDTCGWEIPQVSEGGRNVNTNGEIAPEQRA